RRAGSQRDRPVAWQTLQQTIAAPQRDEELERGSVGQRHLDLEYRARREPNFWGATLDDTTDFDMKCDRARLGSRQLENEPPLAEPRQHRQNVSTLRIDPHEQRFAARAEDDTPDQPGRLMHRAESAGRVAGAA